MKQEAIHGPARDAHPPAGSAIFLGIECGATRSIALAAAEDDPKPLARLEGGPGNLGLLTDEQLGAHLRQLRPRHLPVTALAVCMAGLRNDSDARRVRRVTDQLWPGLPCYLGTDLDAAFFAAGPAVTARVVIVSGTGSCCWGKAPDGKSHKIGGWGHLLGDKGSAYDIALRTLKALVFYLDRDGTWPPLGNAILGSLQLNEPADLVGWVRAAPKGEIAGLAPLVFAASQQRDRVACAILTAAAEGLAADAVACARKIAPRGQALEFILAGSVLMKQPSFARRVAAQIQRLHSRARVTVLAREGAWGAICLARANYQRSGARETTTGSRKVIPISFGAGGIPFPSGGEWLRLSPTEQRNPKSKNLHRLSVRAAIDLMLAEEKHVVAGIRRERPKIEKAIHWITTAFKQDRRLFYAGAGTSGRLGVLDASECPPTFRAPPDRVQGIIAGGQRALWQAVEGAEDDAEAGARAVEFRGVGPGDVLVGIAASGRTPFVWGALWQAKRRGARTILLCFNPRIKPPVGNRPDLVIAPYVGPEVLTGSTRLKAGTATKLVLNLFTTLAMVRVGKAISNLMVDLNASNSKLRDRAVRILCDLTDADESAARAALIAAHWVVKDAWKSMVGRARKTHSTFKS